MLRAGTLGTMDVAACDEPMVASPPAGIRATADSQQIHFSRSRDGVRIAHARHGRGPPLVVVACWLSHL